MTVILAAKSGNHVVIGADSRISLGDSGQVMQNNVPDSKLFRFPFFIVGISGGGPIKETLERMMSATYIPHGEDKEIPYDWTTHKINTRVDAASFARAVWENLKEEYIASPWGSKPNDEGFSNSVGSMLIATKSKIFVAFTELSVIEIKDFYAIGSGGECALSAMEQWYKGKLPVVKLKEAIKASLLTAIKYNVACGKPIQIVEV